MNQHNVVMAGTENYEVPADIPSLNLGFENNQKKNSSSFLRKSSELLKMPSDEWQVN